MKSSNKRKIKLEFEKEEDQAINELSNFTIDITVHFQGTYPKDSKDLTFSKSPGKKNIKVGSNELESMTDL